MINFKIITVFANFLSYKLNELYQKNQRVFGKMPAAKELYSFTINDLISCTLFQISVQTTGGTTCF